ncbi:ubiquitin carboxyl-terminal hydrolase 12-like [Ananas comosus]|uniref:Ubiquitin carboxyl-terminal hydrolase 12-like n=1 Tax=Ananas comosus TaxID=4615 RepID=A0A6P5EWL2_ANACO|nr:ubiquitin carboxyl-terminal hydrolase 12-like [Ananas comosus]
MGSSNSTSRSGEKAFKWRIDGFSSLINLGNEWTNSSSFDAKGLKWYIRVNPMDTKSGDTKRHVSLKLELVRSSVQPNIVIEAVFKLLIYDQLRRKHVENIVTDHFHATSTASGSLFMIPLDTLKESSAGFLINDSCIFGAEVVKVRKVRQDTVSETLFVQKSKNASDVFSWEIEKFTELQKPYSTSKVFAAGGYNWYLKLHPEGDEATNYLSLYATLDKSSTLSPDSGVLVKLSLCIKDQNNDNHKRHTAQIQFTAKCTSWGWGRFISLEDFNDPFNGFLLKNKCTIEASFTVIGLSNRK